MSDYDQYSKSIIIPSQILIPTVEEKHRSWAMWIMWIVWIARSLHTASTLHAHCMHAAHTLPIFFNQVITCVL